VPREIPASRRTGPSAFGAEPSARSLVIPTRNAGARFRQVLERLQRQQLESPVELIVIDSQSDDGTPELAAHAGARVERVMRADFNHGATRNRAIELSSGERIALLAQDALYPPIEALAEISRSVAVAVAMEAVRAGVAGVSSGEDLATVVDDAMWSPEYVPYLRARPVSEPGLG